MYLQQLLYINDIHTGRSISERETVVWLSPSTTPLHQNLIMYDLLDLEKAPKEFINNDKRIKHL